MTNSVAARFVVESITKRATSDACEVAMRADIHADNSEWAKYTPSGSITMHVSGPAASWFEHNLGNTLAITFSPGSE